MIIRNKDLMRVIALYEKNIETPSFLWAFGSRVNGDAHEGSDLDLVIVPFDDKKLNIDELMNFKEALRESNIPILIQVLDWNRVPESFHKNILMKYEVLGKKV